VAIGNERTGRYILGTALSLIPLFDVHLEY